MPRTFDYLVVGAQKAGTTTLWRALDDHPDVRTPTDKERRFFDNDDRYHAGVEDYILRTFPGANREERLGIVSPTLMPGEEASLATLVGRIAATCPAVRLVAILRDPIDRVVSYFRFAKRREQLATDLLEFVERSARRRGGLDRVPFVNAGDYGRILNRYLDLFPREQLLVLLTCELDSHPAQTFRRLYEFLDVDPDFDPGEPRLNVGGVRTRLDDDAMRELTRELHRTVWPHVGDREVRQGFLWWLREVWNVAPDDEEVVVPTSLAVPLAERYLHDAEVLRELLGADPPWTRRLRAIVARTAAGPAKDPNGAGAR